MKRVYLWSMHWFFILQMIYIPLKLCGVCNYSWVIILSPCIGAAGITVFVVLMYIISHLYK
nr:MAG TPA: hypothetical protein [Caudoviricetes sp.]